MCKNDQSHRASVVARITKDCARTLGRGTRSKNSRQSLASAIYTWKSALRPLRIWGGEWGQYRLLFSGSVLTNWKLEHHFTQEGNNTNWSRKPNDIPRMLLASLRQSVVVLTLLRSEMVETRLLRRWTSKPALFCQAGVGVHGSLRLDTCVSNEWISPWGGVCMLKLRLLVTSLCLIQAYRPNSSALYIEFVEESEDAPAKCPINALHIRLDGQMQRCLVSGVRFVGNVNYFCESRYGWATYSLYKIREKISEKQRFIQALL